MKNQTYDNGSTLVGDRRFFLSNLAKPDTVVDLAAGQVGGLRSKRGHQTLLCLQGRVWVTQEGDIRDYVLEKGDAFVVTRPGLVLVQALTQARIGYAENLLPVPLKKGRFTQAACLPACLFGASPDEYPLYSPCRR